MKPSFLLVGCNACHGLGEVSCNGEGRYTCLHCLGASTWIVDVTNETPSTFLDFYGSARGCILQDQGEHVTAYVTARGWTAWDVGDAAPAWLELPEGPSRVEFEEERRAFAPLAKTMPSNVLPFRRTA